MMRVTLREAAHILGVSEGAVRKRVSRGSIPSEMGEDGLRYVYLEEEDAGEDEGSTEPGSGEDASVYSANAELRARVESLERALESEREARRRADHIIAALTERIPELEAPPQSAQEAESAAESASEGADGGEAEEARTEAQSAGEQERVPWWRRLFGKG